MILITFWRIFQMRSTNRYFFVTGTDTGIGKTTTTKQLILGLQQRGFTAAGCKPIACGLNENGQNEDVLIYQNINSLPMSRDQINPVCLTLPASPNIAAKYENQALEVSTLAESLQSIRKLPLDFIFYEGAGGWKVPINDKETLADLAISLQLPIILVIGIRVGCLNHALLTWDAVSQQPVTLAGWISNLVSQKRLQ